MAPAAGNWRPVATHPARSRADFAWVGLVPWAPSRKCLPFRTTRAWAELTMLPVLRNLIGGRGVAWCGAPRKDRILEDSNMPDFSRAAPPNAGRYPCLRFG